MDSQQLISGGQPTSGDVVRGVQPYRGSCDPCRTRKARCSGERPVCSRCASANKDCCYSSRMPLGRPRSKRKKPTCPQRPVTHAVSRENSTSPTNRVASSPESHGDIATVQPAQFTFLTQLRSGQDGGLPYCTPMTGSDRIDQMPPHQLYPELDRGLLAATVSPPSTDECACLSEQYLLLEQLRLKSQLIVPEDLHLLRETVRKAFMILNCQHCPLRYFAIIQNSVILETKRLESNGEHKRVRLSNVHEDGSYHANLPGDTSLFPVNLVPTEWRTIMRKVLKAEIFGRSVKRAGIGTRLRLIVPVLTGRAASFLTGYRRVFD
ncbi:hypothetical protein AAWM_00005 [Aspergillus awamori]|uniref:Zn(2)-C6 fungal-type domain-containing protein n=1 Tax=Aspergillus awamori TaxID=105351 RepID=A0A401KCT5_ASPAW|nr:hypothetical protein AAWM_00005 [Aspergillus awamori]